MNILFFIQNICSRFFYGHSTHQTTRASGYAVQARTIPPQVVTKMNFHSPVMPQTSYDPSFTAKLLASRVIFPSVPTRSPTLTPTPLSSYPKVSQNQGFAQGPSGIQTQDILSQSLQNQINQLESEKKAILAQIALEPFQKTPSKSIYPLSTLVCRENVEKHSELVKLDARFKNTSQFCNQEMFEVLHLVMDGEKSLNKRLTTLRKETACIEDETLLCKNIENIAILEKAIEALHQLEAKFQDMQKATFRLNPSSQSKQEAYISSLLEKIDKLNKQKQFLNECQQNLPTHTAYDAKGLCDLMQLFENEGEELSQKTKESHYKLNQAEKFAHELTNHLLDYTEIFKNHFQKLQQQTRIIQLPTLTPIPTPIPLQPVVTRLNPPTHTLNRLPPILQARIQTAEEEFDSSKLRAAAIEVATAIKQLMQTTSSI